MKRVSAAQAKAHLSALMGEVAHEGERVVIERRGKPLAALVGIADLEGLARVQAPPTQRRGALAPVRVWREVDEGEIDAIAAGIFGWRSHDTRRPMETET